MRRSLSISILTTTTLAALSGCAPPAPDDSATSDQALTEVATSVRLAKRTYTVAAKDGRPASTHFKLSLVFDAPCSPEANRFEGRLLKDFLPDARWEAKNLTTELRCAAGAAKATGAIRATKEQSLAVAEQDGESVFSLTRRDVDGIHAGAACFAAAAEGKRALLAKANGTLALKEVPCPEPGGGLILDEPPAEEPGGGLIVVPEELPPNGVYVTEHDRAGVGFEKLEIQYTSFAGCDAPGIPESGEGLVMKACVKLDNAKRAVGATLALEEGASTKAHRFTVRVDGEARPLSFVVPKDGSGINATLVDSMAMATWFERK